LALKRQDRVDGIHGTIERKEVLWTVHSNLMTKKSTWNHECILFDNFDEFNSLTNYI